jgi:hypothetical protein
VTVATVGKARRIIITITSGRIATIAITVTTTTSTRRNRRTRLLLIAAIRHSSYALRTDQRAITPSKSATRIPKFKTSDDDELRASVDMPVPSEDLASASTKGKNNEDENYHLNVDKKLKSGSHVPCKSDHQQHRSKSKMSQKGKKGEASPTFIDDDLNFKDTILMGLDSIDADLNRPDDITNPSNFSM